MRQIPLRARDGSVRAYALVDDEDYEAVTAKRRGRGPARWSLDSDGYAVRSTWRDGRRVGLKLHRLVLGLTDPALEADHISGDKLDNRRQNLRPATCAQNQQNRTRSPMRNVWWNPKRGRFAVTLKVDGRGRTIGHYKHADEAIEAARAARRRYLPYATT
jgi:hypothetical protein